jgi:hypothetical protein
MFIFQVKKILDKQRCQELMEGDILIDINNIIVRNMSHNKVVQVLKDCLTNEAANITIQRCIQNSPDKFRVKNKKDVKNMYRSKTPTMDSYGDRSHEVNRAKTPIIDNRTQISKIPNNLLENGSSDTYVMNNSLPLDEYCHRDDNSWMHTNSPPAQMYIPTSLYNGVIDPSIGHYINPPDHSAGLYMNSQPDNYSNHLSKSIQNMSFEHYEINASKNKVR